jgi:DNA polymerase elongation subunit (family B)
MNQTETIITVDVEGEDDPVQMTAKEVYEWIYEQNSNLCLTANGTIFRTDIDGLVPGLLTQWFADRKDMQKKKKEYDKLVQENYNDPEKLKEYKYWRDYWDHRQQARKINLNAAYGALTNAGSRFFDQRIGQSTTLSGRTISKHMNSKISELLVGDYSINQTVIKYGDTDSSYFSVAAVKEELESAGFELNKDTFVELANGIADQVNESFPGFMVQAFNTSEDRKGLIKCGREVCATKALFVKKKRYAILYYDKENSRKDYDNKPGDLKIMGMDTQRADTPKPIQDFLKEVLMRVLKGETEKQIIDYIRDFRSQVKTLQPWEKGTPKRVNNLTMYEQKMKAKNKVTVPGHVRASVNWNMLRKMNNDAYAIQISDGQKVIVCKLKNNPLGYTSIAYPVDEFNLPSWFKTLPFDTVHMEEKLIDQKLDNIIGVLGWDIELSKLNNTFVNLFEFE